MTGHSNLHVRRSPSQRRDIGARIFTADAEPLATYAAQRGVDPLTGAFGRRHFVAPWQGSEPVAQDDAGTTLGRIFATPRTQSAVAYVHVPYCQNHCLFCGFFQNVWRPEGSAAFVDDVVAEVARLADRPLVASAPVEAVYIGGGTPSALSGDDLARLVAGLRRHLPLALDCEITVEGRVHDFGLAKAVAALDAGANRISLGIQCFNTDVRRRLGRKASGEEVYAFLADLIALGRASIGCDLIYGLPGQTQEIWHRDIEMAIDLRIDGLTIYALNIWPGGPLFQAIDAGKLAPAGPLPFQAEAYRKAADLLASDGWRQASQAHFVRSHRDRNRYNRLIKAGVPCLAFGPGAGGQAHGHTWRNIVDIPRRRMLIAQGRMPVEGLARLPRDHAARTAIASGLEDGMLDLAGVDRLAPGFAEASLPLLQDWAEAGLGDLEATGFRTTRAGAFWITTLTKGLYAALALRERTSIAEGNAHMTIADTSETTRAQLASRLAADQDGVIETLAREHGVTVLEATRMLPQANCRWAPAAVFHDVFTALAAWGEVLFLVHTPNVILECVGLMPRGTTARGYFNLGGKGPIGGHVKADRCAAIAFVRRPFMGLDSCSIQFFDVDGGVMFKIFVRRHEDHKLDKDQVAAFETLARRHANVRS